MATIEQIKANGRNSLLSTGPKTAQGKAISSANAIKWGLFSQRVLLSDENQKELDLLVNKLHEELHPVGEVEGLWVDLITTNIWRLARVMKIETGIFQAYRFYKETDGG